MKFPIVRSLEDLKTEDFQSPEASVSPKEVLGQIEVGEEIGSFLSQEAAAGRAVYLTLLPVTRLDGVFLVAGMVKPVDVAPPISQSSAQSASSSSVTE